jgi:hypothetical protein
MTFIINVVVFVICMVIQYIALNKRAAGRSLFITISMFFFTGLVFISPSAPRWMVWTLFIITWAYTLYITGYAIARLRTRKR